MSKAIEISGCPNYYVTDSGDVYSRNYSNGRFRRLKPWKGERYYRVRLPIGKKSIHRLVAETFIPNPENKPYINHINGIKTDNRVENLEWVTQSENIIHSYRVLGNKNPMLGKYGEKNHRSKAVVQLKNGEEIKVFGGVREARRMTGIGHIDGCCRGERKMAGGYQWKYKN